MSTTIVCLRHAKPITAGFSESALYPISDEGREIQLKLLNKLKQKDLIPNHIYSSPILRARQTAEIAADLFEIPVEIESALGENFNDEIILQKILSEVSISSSTKKTNSIFYLIGHAPTLPGFVNALVGKHVISALAQSSAAIISFENNIAFGQGIFVDYLT